MRGFISAWLRYPLILSALCTPAYAQVDPSPSEAIISSREEALSYSIGLQAYIYAYPALDYMRVMRDQTTLGLDPTNVYAPLNQIYFQDAVPEPGGFYAGRAPSSNTIYFTAWIDVSKGPVTVEAPDMEGRYYALTFADFYSDVQHTGRRTTGTRAQQVLVVGPDWHGDAPDGFHLIRLRTHQGYLLGRVLVKSPSDGVTVKKLMRQFRMDGPDDVNIRPEDLPKASDVKSEMAFRFINAFLRANPRLPGEEALMAQFDQVSIGPQTQFNEATLSAASRRGFAKAAADGYTMLISAPRAAPRTQGWSAIVPSYGNFGYDYLQRAMIEASGFLINLPAEAVYPNTQTDANGDPLLGAKRYRMVFPADGLPPQDGFWSISPYDVATMDLIPNPLKRYTIADYMPDLKRRADGAVEIRIQNNAPQEKDVNWLPTGDGRFFLAFRIYQPGQEILNGVYKLPAVEPLP